MKFRACRPLQNGTGRGRSCDSNFSSKNQRTKASTSCFGILFWGGGGCGGGPLGVFCLIFEGVWLVPFGTRGFLADLVAVSCSLPVNPSKSFRHYSRSQAMVLSAFKGWQAPGSPQAHGSTGSPKTFGLRGHGHRSLHFGGPRCTELRNPTGF